MSTSIWGHDDEDLWVIPINDDEEADLDSNERNEIIERAWNEHQDVLANARAAHKAEVDRFAEYSIDLDDELRYRDFHEIEQELQSLQREDDPETWEMSGYYNNDTIGFLPPAAHQSLDISQIRARQLLKRIKRRKGRSHPGGGN